MILTDVLKHFWQKLFFSLNNHKGLMYTGVPIHNGSEKMTSQRNYISVILAVITQVLSIRAGLQVSRFIGHVRCYMAKGYTLFYKHHLYKHSQP